MNVKHRRLLDRYKRQSVQFQSLARKVNTVVESNAALEKSIKSLMWKLNACHRCGGTGTRLENNPFGDVECPVCRGSGQQS